MNDRFFFVCHCPICEQGLCRVRVSMTDEQAMFGCIVCDECEATWTDPTLQERFRQADPEVPVCPKCNVQLWGEQSRWADEVDLCLLGWYSKSMGASRPELPAFEEPDGSRRSAKNFLSSIELHTMEIWPAIDLYNGNCVRLQQGDYDRDTVFSNDPGAMAKRWFDEGASFLHCVDLDGARSGSIINESAIRSIIAAAEGRPVQLGGGVRTETTIERLLGLGLSRLVVGTAALKEPAWFGLMCQRYAGHIVLGLDARDGKVATEGWLETSSTLAVDLVQRIAEHTSECVAVVYTDIARDGMMAGPNFEQLVAMQLASPFPVIASGGVTTLEDIDQLVKNRTHGAILGRTLYEGHIRLSDVLQRAKSIVP